ncbi:hypothetical protein HDU67_006740 [Dinochytrium kinnereticum]|nr:hypothetical protein HDU67_006740 [Dinochytrium kinnereticum]
MHIRALLPLLLLAPRAIAAPLQSMPVTLQERAVFQLPPSVVSDASAPAVIDNLPIGVTKPMKDLNDNMDTVNRVNSVDINSANSQVEEPVTPVTPTEVPPPIVDARIELDACMIKIRAGVTIIRQPQVKVNPEIAKQAYADIKRKAASVQAHATQLMTFATRSKWTGVMALAMKPIQVVMPVLQMAIKTAGAVESTKLSIINGVAGGTFDAVAGVADTAMAVVKVLDAAKKVVDVMGKVTGSKKTMKAPVALMLMAAKECAKIVEKMAASVQVVPIHPPYAGKQKPTLQPSSEPTMKPAPAPPAHPIPPPPVKPVPTPPAHPMPAPPAHPIPPPPVKPVPAPPAHPMPAPPAHVMPAPPAHPMPVPPAHPIPLPVKPVPAPPAHPMLVPPAHPIPLPVKPVPAPPAHPMPAPPAHPVPPPPAHPMPAPPAHPMPAPPAHPMPAPPAHPIPPPPAKPAPVPIARIENYSY